MALATLPMAVTAQPPAPTQCPAQPADAVGSGLRCARGDGFCIRRHDSAGPAAPPWEAAFAHTARSRLRDPRRNV